MADNESVRDDVIVGIDLGTTNSAIGVVDSGFPILLADENGKRLTPSVVWYPADGGEAVAGEVAVRSAGLEPGNVVRSVKRSMGERGAAGEVCVRDGERVSAEAVSAVILGRLKAVAERALGHGVTRAVITVPAYFNDGQRHATKRAAELAGLTVERIVNEPTAAALAYGLDKLDDRARVAVYDLGGGTFDISVLELIGGVFQVLATKGDTRLGGDDIDAAVAAWLAAEVEAQTGAKVPEEQQWRLVQEAERVKRELSDADQAVVRLPFIVAGKSAEVEVSRQQLEALAAPVVERTVACCRQALADAGLEAGELDEVILVGGSTRMPLVRALAERVFGKTPNVSQHPDEAVALGAVVQAGVLSGAIREVVLLDVTPLSLGIETFGGLMNVIIPRNTTIPAKAGELFTNAVPNQESMLVRVLQGERELAKDNWTLGEFEVPFESGPKGSARVGVQFRIDEDGILEVLMRDTNLEDGEDRVFEIRDVAVNVDDEAVERMVSESVEHAFDDFEGRRFVEAKLKAEELLGASAVALAQLGDDVAEDERRAIGEMRETLRAALEVEDAAAVAAAFETLEKATEPLAEKLIAKLF